MPKNRCPLHKACEPLGECRFKNYCECPLYLDVFMEHNHERKPVARKHSIICHCQVCRENKNEKDGSKEGAQTILTILGPRQARVRPSGSQEKSR